MDTNIKSITKAIRKKVRGQIPQSVRFNVFRRDGFLCQYCGKGSPDVVLHCDHMKSVKDGGGDGEDNLITACIDCNLGKSSKSVKLSDKAAPPPSSSNNGLIEMWGHTRTAGGEIEWQFQIIRLVSADLYVCQLFSWLDGSPTKCVMMALNDLMRHDLYASNDMMNEAYAKECQKQRRKREREVRKFG